MGTSLVVTSPFEPGTATIILSEYIELLSQQQQQMLNTGSEPSCLRQTMSD